MKPGAEHVKNKKYKRLKNKDVSEQEIKQQKAQMKLHKYIGETSRSTYE